ncbi:MAG: amino acid ABC transporter permease [Clostridia bacterium]|nr:amino acid ABC transporter permease [Clostridia bacterium]
MDYEYIIGLIPQIVKGMDETLNIFWMTLVLSLPLGLLLALGRISRFKPLSWLVGLYLLIFRGTPLMLQMFFIYFGLPFIKIINPFTGELIRLALDRFPAALLAFVLNYAAYFAEIFRGGIISVQKGQYEASKALGLNSYQTMSLVVIPQMLRSIVPPVANEAIVLVKDTALVSSIAIIDILKRAQQIVSRDMNVMAFAVVAVFYLIFSYVLTKLFEFAEKRLSISTKN